MTEQPQEQTQPLTEQLPKLTLSDDGQVCYQPLASNPLPGDAVAKLVKGDSLFAPKFERFDSAPLSQEDLQTAFDAHLKAQLPVFFALLDDGEAPVAEPVKAICQAVYDAAGMLPREVVQAQLKDLDADMRAQLRSKGLRLGPLFIYCPEMNKPAPLRIRALLWGLFNDMPLPVTRVPDGVVSKRIVEEGAEPLPPAQADLYKALCYPVYGQRVIRIDMLDRVVNAVYEGADKGKFQAQHTMAEWLGCSIPDLYAVLEELGHKKIYDPADEAEAAAETAETETPETAAVVDAAKPAPEENAETPPTVEQETAAAEGEAATAKPSAPAPKPQLATFALKRGQAHSAGEGRKPRQNQHNNKNKADAKNNKDGGKKKPFNKKKKQDRRDQGPRVISSGPDKPSLENSPFAVLGQLKK